MLRNHLEMFFVSKNLSYAVFQYEQFKLAMRQLGYKPVDVAFTEQGKDFSCRIHFKKF